MGMGSVRLLPSLAVPKGRGGPSGAAIAEIRQIP
jgi:hypothetical protein